jgi:hypothetical protein
MKHEDLCDCGDCCNKCNNESKLNDDGLCEKCQQSELDYYADKLHRLAKDRDS